MSRPRGFADLVGRRVGIYGVGIEGRAALARLQSLGVAVVLVDDAPSSDDVLPTGDGGRAALLACDVVLKSPGIPKRSELVGVLQDHGVVVASALNLWLGDMDPRRVIGVTGTKGKSTTTSLITFALNAVGQRARAVGNIGVAPYDPSITDDGGYYVLEMSSFQCVDLETAPGTIVVTSLGSDHLDWHGSLEDYHRDKLSVTRLPGAHHTVVADAPELRAAAALLGGDVTYVAPDQSDLRDALHLLGDHSRSNLALTLTVVADVTGLPLHDVRAAVAANAGRFVPLEGRLTLVDTIDGVRFVDDGLATSVLPVLAALDVFADEPLSLIVGGFDRGVDYDDLADAIAQRSAPTFVTTLGPAGTRIGLLLEERGVSATACATVADAVTASAQARHDGGVVLLSPGAPSFDAYENWKARSDDFARCVRAWRGR